MIPAGSVASEKWTGWSSWQTAVDPALRPACSWGYRTAELRAGAFLITDDPPLTSLTPMRCCRCCPRDPRVSAPAVTPTGLHLRAIRVR